MNSVIASVAKRSFGVLGWYLNLITLKVYSDKNNLFFVVLISFINPKDCFVALAMTKFLNLSVFWLVF